MRTEKLDGVANNLNTLLADFHLYYQKLRNFHWNVRGRHFFALHAKFESLYTDARTKIDEVAERILTIMHRPVSNFSDYLEMSEINESAGDLSDKEMVVEILEAHGALIKTMRSTLETADEAHDEGTIDLIGGYLRDIEKESWMLNAWVEEKYAYAANGG